MRVWSNPKMKARFTDLGAATFTGSSADFARLIAGETERQAHPGGQHQARLNIGNTSCRPRA